jgi:Pyruvate/2-oxoacid:ferredoxin oxidoreductase gamma subunit
MERAVIMTGIGGQGIQLIARVLAQAGIREGRQVMTFGVFHGTIRGGSSESTVVLADDEIVTPPIVSSAWAVVAMHGEGLPRLCEKIAPGGVLLYNAGLVAHAGAREDVRQIAVAASEAAKAIGQPLGASMIALGAFAAATGIVSLESLATAAGDVVPPHRRRHAEGNRRCLEHGAELLSGAVPAGVAAWT